MSYLIPSAAREVYNLHPMFVHFPVALLPSALLLFGLAVWKKKESLIIAGRACLYLGAFGALLATLTGWRAEGGIPHNGTIHAMMQTHKYAALLVLTLVSGLSAWSFKLEWSRRGQVSAFVGILFLLNLVWVSVGDLGVRMVYLEGAGVKPAAEVITTDGDHDHSTHHHTH